MTDEENCASQMLNSLERTMPVLVEALKLTEVDTAKLSDKLEVASRKIKKIGRHVGFEFASKRKDLQDQLDQLDLEEKKEVDVNLAKEGLSDRHLKLIEAELDATVQKSHETSELLLARNIAIEKQRENGKYFFSYKYPTFILSF